MAACPAVGGGGPGGPCPTAGGPPAEPLGGRGSPVCAGGPAGVACAGGKLAAKELKGGGSLLLGLWLVAWLVVGRLLPIEKLVLDWKLLTAEGNPVVPAAEGNPELLGDVPLTGDFKLN